MNKTKTSIQEIIQRLKSKANENNHINNKPSNTYAERYLYNMIKNID